MIAKKISSLPSACLACALVLSGSLRAEPISVTDLKGRTIDIDLVAVSEGNVTFSRAGKVFTLPISNFDEASQGSIRKEAARIPAALPKIQPDIIIGKRRQKEDSHYMVKQEITCTVKLTNPSLKDAVPPLTGKIVFIGQDRRTPELFNVLSTQDVEVSIEPGKTFEKEMESFITTYDSDNKGVGNVGGSQYVGYVLVLLNGAGDVVMEHTVEAGFRKALAEKPVVAKEMINHRKGMILTKTLDPAPIAAGGRAQP